MPPEKKVEIDRSQLNQLLDAVTDRLTDAMKDMQATVQCVEAFKNDPTKAQTCILTYLRTGEPPRAPAV